MSVGATEADRAAQRAYQQARQARLYPTRLLPSHTPGRLRWMSGISVVAVAVLLAVAWSFVSWAQDSVTLIGSEAGPRASSSAELYHALAEMDNQVARVVLIDSTSGVNGADQNGVEDDGQATGDADADRSEALDLYEERRTEANRAALETSSLTAGDDEAVATMGEILDGVGHYERLAAEVLLLSAESNGDETVSAEVRELYAEATDHMREEVLPKAYNLSLESTSIIRAATEEGDATLQRGQLLVALTGVVVIATLVILQLYVRAKFRRRLSPALLAASVVVAVMAVGTLNSLAVVSSDLRSATDDGLDSEVRLAQARAISAATNGDQTRYLIDSARADTYEQTYLEASQSVLFVPGDSVDTFAEAAEAAVAEYRGESHDTALFDEIVEQQPDGMLGLLGEHASTQELTEEQRDGVESVLEAYLQVRQADLEMRDSSTLLDAAELRLDESDDGLAGAQLAYEAELTELIEVHNETFVEAVDSANSELGSSNVILPVGAVLAAALVVFGVRPRIVEYTQNRRETEGTE
ncbi:hypothetical protein J4H86_25325 [Spiractinospora alimapuensis]|uniref:hypothetical protein n=1 Tax=Spiractinospora alimapuensis TaxID=2820884 RepID=UPI001F18C973|nr:hypothetical protein [Spiractinospora alimapuensis]QVQ52015.1 hypothetical protein J4H86_25325 [Spiractinospora alimapuensis]